MRMKCKHSILNSQMTNPPTLLPLMEACYTVKVLIYTSVVFLLI